MSTVKTNLETLRREKGYSTQTLAELSSVFEATIINIENLVLDTKDLEYGTLELLADALNTSVDSIIGINEDYVEPDGEALKDHVVELIEAKGESIGMNGFHTLYRLPFTIEPQTHVMAEVFYNGYTSSPDGFAFIIMGPSAWNSLEITRLECFMPTLMGYEYEVFRSVNGKPDPEESHSLTVEDFIELTYGIVRTLENL